MNEPQFSYYTNPERVVICGNRFKYPSTSTLNEAIMRRFREGTTPIELALLFGKSKFEIFKILGECYDDKKGCWC